jgi:hypothetical protein
MGIRQFAFIADNDVFTIFKIDDSIPGNQPVIAGLGSKPLIVEIDNETIDVGWKFIDGEFYMPASQMMASQAPDYEVDDD